MTSVAAGHDVDDTIRELKKIPGFSSFCILNNDGIVIKYENMSYKVAVHHAHLILSLTGKASKYVRDLFDSPDNEVDSIRLHTDQFEMIVAQHGNFTLIVSQTPNKVDVKATEEKKEEGADAAAAAAAAASKKESS